MDIKERALKQVDFDFDLVFGPRREDSLVESLIRSSARAIVQAYPDNRHRTLALVAMLSAAEHLKHAEGRHV